MVFLKRRRFSGRAVTIILCVTLIMSMYALSVYADESFYGIVTADVLNVRAEATTESAIVGKLLGGTFVKVEELQPGWAKILFKDGTSYVSSEYLLIRAGEMPSRSADITDKGTQVIEYAKQFLGTPYKYGGMSKSGFDCSGFTKYVYSNFGVNINRVAAAQMSNGTAVTSKAELQPGDLVFFYQKVGSSNIGHVGIYAGNGQMIHSPYTGTSIRFETIMSGTYSARYAGARRILD